MKISEAMRIGASKRLQTTYQFFGYNKKRELCSCAIGAIYEGRTGDIMKMDEAINAEHCSLASIIEETSEIRTHPVTFKEESISLIIEDLMIIKDGKERKLQIG